METFTKSAVHFKIKIPDIKMTIKPQHKIKETLH
jgi:hypothetical protein